MGKCDVYRDVPHLTAFFCLQEIDTDYIKQTHCTDPVDQREHLISEVSLEHMYCAKAPAAPEPGSAATASLTTILLAIQLVAVFAA